MAGGFYYYVPSLGGFESLMHRFGLGYAFDDHRPPAITEIGQDLAPDGKSGTVLWLQTTPRVPAVLEWYNSGKGWWLGWLPDDPPDCHRLRKRGAVLGMSLNVELADGGEWEIPLVYPCTAIDPQRKSGLPLVYSTANGKHVSSREVASNRWQRWHSFMLGKQDVQLHVHDRYRNVYDLAAGFVGDIESGRPIAQRTIFQYCVRLLQVCYRVSETEILALELFTQDAVQSMWEISIDWHERILANMSEPDRQLVMGQMQRAEYPHV